MCDKLLKPRPSFLNNTVFWPKMNKVTEEWRRLHNEEHYDLYSSSNIIRLGGTCGEYGGQGRCIQDIIGRPQVKKPLARHRRRWEEIIKIDLQKVGWGMGWIGLETCVGLL